MPAKKKTAKKAVKKTAKKTAKKGGAAFGGYTISFEGCMDTLNKIFGNAPIPPSQMTKKLWDYVKKNNLHGK